MKEETGQTINLIAITIFINACFWVFFPSYDDYIDIQDIIVKIGEF